MGPCRDSKTHFIKIGDLMFKILSRHFEIKHEDGVKRILKQLDKLYLQDTNQSTYLAYQTLEEFKRPKNMPMKFEKL